MSTASPTVEALEAEETEEEKNIDELDAALEASRETGEEDVEAEPDKTGEEPSKEMAEEEPAKDPSKEPEPGAEKVSEEPEKKPDVEEKEPTAQELLEQQNIELRQLLRDQKKDMAVMQAKLGRMEVGLKDSVEEDGGELPELSEVEQLQLTISKIGQEKGTLFETLVEAMEAKPEFADIREVCSREHFDDIFEEVGRGIAAKEKTDPVVAQLALEAEVWQMDNPYKYMYGIIKEYHPKYADKEPEKKEPEPAAPEKKPELAEAPTSLASVGGSDADTKSGWTSKRIDELPEDELGQVPDGIYQKYLRGELD